MRFTFNDHDGDTMPAPSPIPNPPTINTGVFSCPKPLLQSLLEAVDDWPRIAIYHNAHDDRQGYFDMKRVAKEFPGRLLDLFCSDITKFVRRVAGGEQAMVIHAPYDCGHSLECVFEWMRDCHQKRYLVPFPDPSHVTECLRILEVAKLLGIATLIDEMHQRFHSLTIDEIHGWEIYYIYDDEAYPDWRFHVSSSIARAIHQKRLSTNDQGVNGARDYAWQFGRDLDFYLKQLEEANEGGEILFAQVPSTLRRVNHQDGYYTKERDEPRPTRSWKELSEAMVMLGVQDTDPRVLTGQRRGST